MLSAHSCHSWILYRPTQDSFASITSAHTLKNTHSLVSSRPPRQKMIQNHRFFSPDFSSPFTLCCVSTTKHMPTARGAKQKQVTRSGLLRIWGRIKDWFLLIFLPPFNLVFVFLHWHCSKSNRLFPRIRTGAWIYSFITGEISEYVYT